MRVYAVGGSVRDELLGLPVADRDYVVVGATPEAMVRAGFRPVGRDFPVFLHPQTHEEYALARTERKSGRGYQGFTVYAAPDVTLEADLARRDLTINAIAKDESGRVIDPYGGEADLRAGVLRHVSPAFVEDPVRLLRVARFAARFGFAVAPETMALMRTMVVNGEVDHLVSERVWQELGRGLMEKAPNRMLGVLVECGALARVLPEVDAAIARAPLDHAVAHGFTLAQRYGVLLAGSDDEAVCAVSDRLRVPTECRDMARLVARFAAMASTARTPAALLDLLVQADALRRPERFTDFLAVCRALGGAPDLATRALAVVSTVDAGAIARTGPPDIPDAIRAARIAAIASMLA